MTGGKSATASQQDDLELKLVVIADDFTGALDTGVQFSAQGIPTQIALRRGRGTAIHPEACPDAQVLVIDSETRHLSASEAHDIVAGLVLEARSLGVPHIYKKTDSALRGNLGAELSAVWKYARTDAVAFIPAFPDMKRTTQGGIHYIDGVPVSQSVFGQDPFEPVTRDDVAAIIAQQSDVAVTNVRDLGEQLPTADGIWVFDAASRADVAAIAANLKRQGWTQVLAGCAGFAKELPALLHLERKRLPKDVLEDRLLVVCGSVNPITRAQLAYGEAHGYAHTYLTPDDKLVRAAWQQGEGRELAKRVAASLAPGTCQIVDSNDPPGSNATRERGDELGLSLEDLRARIAGTMGVALKTMLDEIIAASTPAPVILVTGGDTLLGFLREVGQTELRPIAEIQPGCVLTKVPYRGREYHVITKSGGFGEEQLLESLMEILGRNQR